MDPDSNPHFDERMGINKTKLLRPKRMSFQFVEEGKWSKEAETIKLRVLIVSFTFVFWRKNACILHIEKSLIFSL